MNLLQLRQQFKTISGRYDLVNDDGSDNGANFYINEGRKFLDRLDETQKSWASRFLWLQPTLWGLSFEYCRAIKEVWAMSTDSRWQLEKVNLQDIIGEYLNSASRDSGTPLYYSPAITRVIPEGGKVTDIEAFVGYVDILSDKAYGYNAILIAPPTDTELAIEIRGLFHSKELTNDTDENYWSAQHPMLLIMAAMRQLEIVNRNTQGVNDWEASIIRDMQLLGFDLVEELIAEVDDMEG